MGYSNILPQWKGQDAGAEPIRFRSTDRSASEEPYTMEIVLAKCFALAEPWTFEATDLSNRVLEAERRIICESKRLGPAPRDLILRYFQSGIGKWEGSCLNKDELRVHVAFQRLNLFESQGGDSI